MKRGTPEYRAFHAAEMRVWRAQFHGPKRPRSFGGWRGVESSESVCLWCGNVFQRTKQPRMKVYCGVPCRSASKGCRRKTLLALDHARKNPPKPKVQKEPVQPSCFGCKWRDSLFCGHPGLDRELEFLGSVSLAKSGKCPLDKSRKIDRF